MQKIFKRLRKEESGQSLVMVVLLMSVLLGFSALIVDVGLLYAEKAKLQNAADAAALAGAQVLPNKTLAEGFVETYANSNGVLTSNISGISYPGTDNKKIKVDLAGQVPHIFANFLDLFGTSTTVTASAIAQTNKWAGEALPFINLDGDGENSTKGQPLSAWNKVGPGDKERINNGDLVINTNSIKVNFEDGFIEFKKGKDMSQVKDPLDNILVIGGTVYLFSLKKSEMANYEKKGTKELKEGDKIPLTDVVLLECVVTEWDDKLVTLKFVNSYNISTLGITTATDGSLVKISSKLIE